MLKEEETENKENEIDKRKDLSKIEVKNLGEKKKEI